MRNDWKPGEVMTLLQTGGCWAWKSVLHWTDLRTVWVTAGRHHHMNYDAFTYYCTHWSAPSLFIYLHTKNLPHPLTFTNPCVPAMPHHLTAPPTSSSPAVYTVYPVPHLHLFLSDHLMCFLTKRSCHFIYPPVTRLLPVSYLREERDSEGKKKQRKGEVKEMWEAEVT